LRGPTSKGREGKGKGREGGRGRKGRKGAGREGEGCVMAFGGMNGWTSLTTFDIYKPPKPVIFRIYSRLSRVPKSKRMGIVGAGCPSFCLTNSDKALNSKIR